MTYWIEFIKTILPNIFFTSISILPLIVGLYFSIYYLRKNIRIKYIKNIYPTILAGIFTLFLLYDSFYSDALSSSSTAGLIFLFTPIYASILYGIVYAFIANTIDVSQESRSIFPKERMLIHLPLMIFLLLFLGILKNTYQGNDRSLAYETSNTKVIVQLYDESQQNKVDSFSISLGLSQNPHTPKEILKQLSQHKHKAIRTHVAQHKSTPINTINQLQNDNSLCVRNAANKKLNILNSVKP